MFYKRERAHRMFPGLQVAWHVWDMALYPRVLEMVMDGQILGDLIGHSKRTLES